MSQETLRFFLFLYSMERRKCRAYQTVLYAIYYSAVEFLFMIAILCSIYSKHFVGINPRALSILHSAEDE